MTDFNDELPEETAQNQSEPEPLEQDEDTWLHVILSIPYIGGILTTFIGLLPIILIFAFFGFEQDAGAEGKSDTVEFFTVLAGIPVLYAWLLLLEKKLRLAICLPLPVVSIRLKWLLIPFGLIWIIAFSL